MARGAKTGGRKKGTPNVATAKVAAEIAATGETPLEYMLRIMRDPNQDPGMRLDAAKSAAQYVHPKLAAIDTTIRGDKDAPIPFMVVLGGSQAAAQAGTGVSDAGD